MITASALAGDIVVCPPFCAADDGLINKAKSIIDKCRYVVDSGCPVGQYNTAADTLCEYAEKSRKIIVSELSGIAAIKMCG